MSMKKAAFYKELFILLGLIIISIIGAIGISNALKQNNKPKEELSIPLEQTLKELIKKQILFESRHVENEVVSQAIQTIIAHLKTGIENIPYEIDIIIIDSPVVNAIAFPGGMIVIYTGLLKITDNAFEIAAVISHELGHVVHRDSLKLILRQSGLALLLTIITRGDSDGLLQNIIRSLIDTHFSRKQEEAADSYAINLLQKTGISPIYLANIFKKMKQKQNTLEKGILKYISSHPDIDLRIEQAIKSADSFTGPEKSLDIDWKEVKSHLPSVFDK